MDKVVLMLDLEVVDGFPVAGDGLGPNAAMSPLQVC